MLPAAANAQVSFGAKAGGALTSLPGDYSNFRKAGFYGGITGELPVGKKFSIAAELVYSLQGNKQRIKFADWAPIDGYVESEKKASMNLSYLNLPVLVKYHLIEEVYLETGLQAGLLINAKVKTSQGSGDIKDLYESFDLSLPLGAGYQLKNGFGANLRYNQGVTNVYKPTNWKPHNSVIQLGVFYILKKHRLKA
jgi:hypothetical protein